MQSSQLATFRSKKGPFAGNTSAVCYGAYVYFEELRIKNGKPKGRKREEMARLWAGEGGVDRERTHEFYTVMKGSSVQEDKYGQVHITGPDGRTFKA